MSQNEPTTSSSKDSPFSEIRNLTDCVFCITPKLKFDFHKDFQKTITHYRNLLNSLESAKPQEKKHLEKLKAGLESSLMKLKDRVAKEQLLN